MNKNAVQKCRTCLKTSAKTFSLTELATGCCPEKTYGQLLQEYAKLQCSVDYEHLMPHYLCLLCTRELKNIYAFIKQAQYCNDKLLHVIAKKFDCLREKKIDLPENENDLEKSVINNLITIEQREQNVETDESRNEIWPKHFDVTESNNEENVIEEQINICIDLTPELNEINTEDSQRDIACPTSAKEMNTLEDLNLDMHTQPDNETSAPLMHNQSLEIKNRFVSKQKIEANATFDCKLCPSKYTNRYSYDYHLIRKHNIDERKIKEKGQIKSKVLKCRSCNYTARTYAALTYHKRAKHGTENDKFKCQFCNNLFIKKFDLFVHVKNAHRELIKTMKAVAENNGELRKEINYDKLEPPEDRSDEEFSSDDDVPLIKKFKNSKTRIEEEEEQFSDEDFIRNILNIKRKRSSRSSTSSLARKCDECGNIYKNYKTLYAHKKHVHISEDKYSLCPHCGKKYKRQRDLRIHIERDHIAKNPNEIAKQPAKVREKRFMCTECSYVCTTITILNIHINRKHTGQKPYKCDICTKSFLIPYDLKIHRYLHTGERPFKCPICSKGFRDNSHMMKHKRIHSNERPFKCKECGKCFLLAYYLSVHNRTHLKEKKLM